MLKRKVLQKYLEEKEKRPVLIKAFQKLGKGWHGTGYRLTYQIRAKGKIKTQEKNLVLRAQTPINFSHEYPSDRAKVFLFQHQSAFRIPQHIRSFDVVGLETRGQRLVSFGNCAEFFQLVEEVKGTSYTSDLNRILKEKKLKKEDRAKALMLSNYLVKLHREKFKGPLELKKSLQKRHTRDAVGHGEMLLGVLDTYPPKLNWVKKEEIIQLLTKAVAFREKIKNLPRPLVRIHGDFHPGNIIFEPKKTGNEALKFKLLDASRELFGDPADDLTALSINFLWYALMDRGNFSGPFRVLFEIFWDNYLRKTKDFGLNQAAALFFAFRGVVVAHPVFYPNQSDLVRRKIFNFIQNILTQKTFDYRRINSFLIRQPFAFFITGLPGVGKSTVAKNLKEKLAREKLEVKILRLDEIRKKFVQKPKYNQEERDEVYRKFIDEGVKLIEQNQNVIFDATGHLRKYRNWARAQIENFTEVYLRAPLEVCIKRESRRKGGLVVAQMYQKALERKKISENQKSSKKFFDLGQVPGIDAPYEENQKAEIIIEADKTSSKEAAELILNWIFQLKTI